MGHGLDGARIVLGRARHMDERVAHLEPWRQGQSGRRWNFRRCVCQLPADLLWGPGCQAGHRRGGGAVGTRGARLLFGRPCGGLPDVREIECRASVLCFLEAALLRALAQLRRHRPEDDWFGRSINTFGSDEIVNESVLDAERGRAHIRHCVRGCGATTSCLKKMQLTLSAKAEAFAFELGVLRSHLFGLLPLARRQVRKRQFGGAVVGQEFYDRSLDVECHLLVSGARHGVRLAVQ
mmetsp:Transcript_115796/g.327547  ORF Transcript_115796/g.327547 Transcript_115796/m.327547 type:complete len:237 (-) Transcript_115796:80-790(-)